MLGFSSRADCLEQRLECLDSCLFFNFWTHCDRVLWLLAESVGEFLPDSWSCHWSMVVGALGEVCLAVLLQPAELVPVPADEAGGAAGGGQLELG